ncbi:hypothetical protein CRENBAI_026764 [Crenichthys baileyi]|uniref:Uncharacterized protein n=1 Tax=Crenichthys baileyi TaxID=28760 RepID=A0AAV9RH80_9TELE
MFTASRVWQRKLTAPLTLMSFNSRPEPVESDGKRAAPDTIKLQDLLGSGRGECVLSLAEVWFDLPSWQHQAGRHEEDDWAQTQGPMLPTGPSQTQFNKSVSAAVTGRAGVKADQKDAELHVNVEASSGCCMNDGKTSVVTLEKQLLQPINLGPSKFVILQRGRLLSRGENLRQPPVEWTSFLDEVCMFSMSSVAQRAASFYSHPVRRVCFLHLNVNWFPRPIRQQLIIINYSRVIVSGYGQTEAGGKKARL